MTLPGPGLQFGGLVARQSAVPQSRRVTDHCHCIAQSGCCFAATRQRQRCWCYRAKQPCYWCCTGFGVQKLWRFKSSTRLENTAAARLPGPGCPCQCHAMPVPVSASCRSKSNSLHSSHSLHSTVIFFAFDDRCVSG